MPPPPHDDWTHGPAKWAAVAVLGAASITGLAWSILRAERPPRIISAPAPAPELALTITPSSPAPPTPRPPPAAAPTESTPPPPPDPAPPTIARLINLNTAPQAELELLPGIGPALAQRIITHRTANGPFRDLTDLDKVKGIGPRMLEKLKDKVAF